MTIVITGPGRRAPWQGAVFLLIIAVLIVAIGLILLGLAGDFLIDWLWFSATGYLRVFRTIIVTKALTFFVVFVATAIILWVNGSLARRLAQRPWTQRPADLEWKPAGGAATRPALLGLIRHQLPWPLVIAGGAGLLALLVAAGEVSNWNVFLRFIFQVPDGVNDPLYARAVG